MKALMMSRVSLLALAMVVAGQAGAQARGAPTRTAPRTPAPAPAAIPAVKSLSFTSRVGPMPADGHAASSTGGQEVVLRVELTAPAPCVERCDAVAMDGSRSGYMPVTVSGSDPKHFTAQRMLVPTGQTIGELPFVTAPVASPVLLTVSASSVGSAPQQARLTILPPVMTAFALEQSSVISGQEVKGVVHFSGPPASATAVRFQLQTTMGDAVSVPATVALQTGTTAAEITVKARGVPADRNAHVVAIHGEKTLAAPLTVRAARLVKPEDSCCTLRLDGAAPPGGAIISLTSAKPSRATVPPTVTIPEADSTIVVPVVSTPGKDDDRVRITATYNGISQHLSFYSRKLSKPDLVIRDIVFSDSFGNAITTATDGQPIRLCVNVLGYSDNYETPNVPVPPSVLRISHQSPTGTGTSAGRTVDLPVILNSTGYPYLSQAHCITIPGLTEGDRVDVTLVADANGEVDERREGNNDKKVSISRP